MCLHFTGLWNWKGSKKISVVGNDDVDSLSIETAAPVSTSIMTSTPLRLTVTLLYPKKHLTGCMSSCWTVSGSFYDVLSLLIVYLCSFVDDLCFNMPMQYVHFYGIYDIVPLWNDSHEIYVVHHSDNMIFFQI